MQIYNIICDVNLMVSFPFSEADLDRWSKTIVRLFPDVDVKVIIDITDNFLTGKEDFEKDAAILNYTYRIPQYSGR